MAKITETTSGVVVGHLAVFSDVNGNIKDGGPVPAAGGGGSGTVTTVSVATAAGVSGSVANPTTTPAITVVLGNITPASVNATGLVLGSNVQGSTSGTNTGDQTLAGLGGVPTTRTVNGHALSADVVVSATDLTTGTLPAARLPNPSASTLGGVQSAAAVANQFVTSISTSGVPALAQPAFTNISGVAAAAQLPVATTGAFGAVKPDGSTITILAGVISAVTGAGSGGLVGVQTFLNSGTYTPTAGATKIFAFVQGGGGGGGGSGASSPGTGGTGGTSSIGTLAVALGGVGGGPGTTGTTPGSGGAGGVPSAGTIQLTGSSGAAATNNGGASNGGGHGAAGLFGTGAGTGIVNTDGSAAAANTGAGGGGAGALASSYTGAAGGGAGGLAIYYGTTTGSGTITVGAAGAAGASGSGHAGGAGGKGIVIILEFA